ncbi:hypothetical protein HNC20_23795 [Rhodococcus rhodochrous]|uniref:hypothetical protein n=1 Tax=Rhodococcus rhodochrous TaxID=1829 RepID=UPI000750D82D|nr:hypothetical protein [Rhodococcus rhodochrous]MDO1486944.1 hypothetical protein [Rhodococcus rhodochrous]
MDPTLIPLQGRLGDQASIDQRGYAQSLVDLVGNRVIESEMIAKVFAAANCELPGFPQLAGTVSVAAGAVSYAVRAVLRGEILPREWGVKLAESVLIPG